MNRLINFRDILNHKSPENLILDLGGCPLSSMEGDTQNRVLDLLGYKKPEPQRLTFGKVQRLEESLLKYLDIDTRSVGEILHPKNSQFEILSTDVYIDEWGITRKYDGQYWSIIKSPLKDAECKDLDNFLFPDPNSVDILQIEAIAAAAKHLYEEGKYVICAEHPVYGVFELGCWLCGFEDFLIKVMIDPDFVLKLFEKILDYQKKIIKIYYGAIGPYAHYTSSGDDFATQESMFMSLDCFGKLIKPFLKERIGYTKKFTDAKYLHHSCGNVFKLIPDLIDCGVEIINPIQPATFEMNPNNLKQKYGEKIVFHGGCDTQKLLPFGGEESIKEGVKDLISQMNINGGYVFAAAHNLQNDVPPENIIYMFQAARKYGGNNGLR